MLPYGDYVPLMVGMSFEAHGDGPLISTQDPLNR